MLPATDTLSEGLAALGLPATGALCDRLTAYVAAIEAWNPAYGLVGASGRELVVKHILDSLAPLALIRAALADIAASRGHRSAFGLPPPRLGLADLGTGAGLPGIPLALALPELDVALIDRMGKRVRFLENQKAALGLDSVTIVESQVERATGLYDLVTFRAFRPFEPTLFRHVFRLCAGDGRVLAYKGRLERARGELGALDGLYSEARVEPVKVPFLDEERCVVLLRPRA